MQHVRFGSEADICAATIDVRFTPNSDRESGHLGPGEPPIRSRLSIARRDRQVSHIAAARLGGRWRVQREVVSGRRNHVVAIASRRVFHKCWKIIFSTRKTYSGAYILRRATEIATKQQSLQTQISLLTQSRHPRPAPNPRVP